MASLPPWVLEVCFRHEERDRAATPSARAGLDELFDAAGSPPAPEPGARAPHGAAGGLGDDDDDEFVSGLSAARQQAVEGAVGDLFRGGGGGGGGGGDRGRTPADADADAGAEADDFDQPAMVPHARGGGGGGRGARGPGWSFHADTPPEAVSADDGAQAGDSDQPAMIPHASGGGYGKSTDR